MKKLVESGKFDKDFEEIIDRLERPILYVVLFISGTIFGIAWMIAQKLPPF